MKNAIVERDVSHLIFPDEVQVLDAGNQGPGSPAGRLSDTTISPSVARAANCAVSRIGPIPPPGVIVGYGARDDMDEITALAETLRSPVITTFKAKGQISDDHPLGAGVLGRSGTPVASWFMNEADLLIVFGASFSDHTGITTGKPVIQVDFDRMAAREVPLRRRGAVGRHRRDGALLRDPGCPAHRRSISRPSWRSAGRCGGGEARAGGERRRDRHQLGLVFGHLSEVAPPDAILPVDVGNNTYSFGRYFECMAGQSVIMSGYLGSIGFGFPAAMGAWAATPAGGSSRSRRRRLRPVRRRVHDGGEVRHGHHARPAQQLASSARSARSSATVSGRCGRPPCTTRTSPTTPAVRRQGHPG